MTPIPDRPRPRRRPCPGRAAALPWILVLAAAAAGCAPKRVVEGVAVPSGPDPRPAPAAGPPAPAPSPPVAGAPDLGALGLPAPEPRGPAGVFGPERRPESVTLGIEAATLARQQLGKPYQWGAAGPDRFDCSGLVQHVFGELGIALPRVSSEQAAIGREVKLGELQAGDLVFFAIDGDGIDHVGIFVGGSEFIHAPRRYVPVTTESLDNAWWRRRYRLARRLG